MILSCPLCQTRYRLDDGSIPATGRSVRCKNCAHVWRATPPDPSDGGAGSDKTASAIGSPGGSSGNSHGAFEESYAPVPLISETVGVPLDPAVTTAEPRFASGWRGAVGQSESSSAGSRRLLVGWVVLAAIVVVSIAALGIFRVQLVKAWPPANRLYTAIGWPVDGGYGLQLSGVSVAPSVDNGKSVLLVTGKIADVSSVILAIPKLHVFLLADNRQILRQIEMDAGKPELHPGETTSFSLSIDDPPREAASVRIAFAGGAK